MTRFLAMSVLMIVNFVLQSSVLGPAAIFGVLPDTALILTVSCGMLRGEVEGGLFGFFAGLIHDISGGYVVGVFALLGLLTGYLSGKPFKDFFRENFFLPFIIVVIMTLANQFAFYFFTFLFKGKVDLFFYAKEIIVPKTIYTAALAVPIYIAFHRLNERLLRAEAKKP